MRSFFSEKKKNTGMPPLPSRNRKPHKLKVLPEEYAAKDANLSLATIRNNALKYVGLCVKIAEIVPLVNSLILY